MEPVSPFSQKTLERWGQVEPFVFLALGLLLTLAPCIRLYLGYGGIGQLLFIPVGAWCFWQALYECRLDALTPPSFAEKSLASLWLWTRRLVLWGVGAVFLGLSYLAFSDFNLLVALISLFLGLFALWTAWYGSGVAKSICDDREVYLRRKERYRWRL